jgi:hypothetical protein
MNYETWVETYKPVSNHLRAERGFEGTMFETFGAEIAHVMTQDHRYVWTLVDGGDYYGITPSRRFINRLGYFVTEKPWPADAEFELIDMK